VCNHKDPKHKDSDSKSAALRPEDFTGVYRSPPDTLPYPKWQVRLQLALLFPKEK